MFKKYWNVREVRANIAEDFVASNSKYAIFGQFCSIDIFNMPNSQHYFSELGLFSINALI